MITKHRPFVTVIVPVFNDYEGLISTLNALSVQSYPRNCFEVVVVDNGSCPKVGLAGLTLQMTVRLVVETRPGSYAARNSGILAARGDVLAFTDADCIPDSEWLSNALNCLGDNSARNIVGGDVHVVNNARELTWAATYSIFAGFQQKDNVSLRGFSATANMVVYKDAFDAVGLFDSSLLSGGDSEWCWRAAKEGYRVRFEKSVLVKHPCRTSLRSLAVQARRVAAGRLQLKKKGYLISGSVSSRSHVERKSLVSVVGRIVSNSETGNCDKIKILLVGAIIRFISAIEIVRLRFGTLAERR